MGGGGVGSVQLTKSLASPANRRLAGPGAHGPMRFHPELQSRLHTKVTPVLYENRPGRFIPTAANWRHSRNEQSRVSRSTTRNGKQAPSARPLREPVTTAQIGCKLPRGGVATVVNTTTQSCGQHPHNGTVSLNNAAILIAAHVALPEKPQMSTLKCLFCQYLNPADVDYCNSCDGQLNLQPCYRCGGVDLRTATKCHKCGGAFSLAVPPERDFQFRPSDFDLAGGDDTPRSPEAPPSAALFQSKHPTDGHVVRPSADAAAPQELSPPGNRSQRGTRMAVLVLALLLVIGAISAYVYQGTRSRVDGSQGREEAAGDSSNARRGKESVGSERSPARDATAMPNEAVQSPLAMENDAVRQRSAAAPATEAATSLSLPTTGADAVPLPESSTAKPCPPAVAALGLCNLDMPQEKR